VRSGPRSRDASSPAAPATAAAATFTSPAAPATAAAAAPPLTPTSSAGGGADEEFRAEALALYKKLRGCADGAPGKVFGARSPARTPPPAPTALSAREVHVVASLLARFVREVPGTVWGSSDTAARVLADPSVGNVRAVLRDLPEANAVLLRTLQAHFQHIIAHRAANRMDVDTLAVVVGPALFPRTTADPGLPSLATVAHYASVIPATVAFLSLTQD
jgi:hypothetical protein